MEHMRSELHSVKSVIPTKVTGRGEKKGSGGWQSMGTLVMQMDLGVVELMLKYEVPETQFVSHGS